MVNADERRRPFGEPLDQPFGNAPASPVFARTAWRHDFLRSGQAVVRVNAQTLETRLGCLCTRIVDAEVAFERWVHERGRWRRRAQPPDSKEFTSPSSRVKDDTPDDGCAYCVFL